MTGKRTTEQDSRTGSTPSSQVRDANRRATIITEARRLFRGHGYHSVGIDEIGAASGITGPGIYRHFESKGDILAAVLREATSGLVPSVRTEEMESASPSDRLEMFVDAHIRFVVDLADLASLWLQEWRDLPADLRLDHRRLQRRYEQRWLDMCLDVHPTLSDAEALLRIHAVFGLIESVATFGTDLEGDDLVRVLRSMALAALAG